MAVSPIETRYRTEMNALFDEEARLQSWLEVEVALARAHVKLGNIPKAAASEIAEGAKKVRLGRVLKIEEEIHHDLMAMVKALTEQCPKYGGYVHYGATSYDIEDTAMGLVMKRAVEMMKKRLQENMEVLKKLALKHKNTVCIARTHGQHAVPTTYGMKFALYYQEAKRNLQRLEWAGRRIAVGKMSGAAGTMATFRGKGEKVQELVMKELGLEPVAVASQVVQRDRHAEVLFVLALIASGAEKIAKEIRNLQRTEIMEVAEPFGRKQVGSSTMPQKRNPHKCERVCSLARLVRSNVSVATENIALEHERDLTNSANERFIFPQSFIVTDYVLKEMSGILAGLEFFPQNIKRNLQMSGGAVLAERVMIELAERGMGRQQAHELMRTSAIEARESGKMLLQVLLGKKEVLALLKKAELEKLFDASTYVGDAPKIVEKAVG